MSKDLTEVFKEFEEPKKEESPEKEEEKPEPSKEEEKAPEKEESKVEEKKDEKPKEEEPKKEDKKEESSPGEMPEHLKKYDFSLAKKTAKHCITIYGLKGAGKTYLSLTIPGTHFALTFDNKTQAVAGEVDPNGDRISVEDGAKYYDQSSPDSWLESSEDSWTFIQGVLDALESGWLEENGKVVEIPDWILIDGGEIVHTLLAMVMRHRNNLMPFQGIPNLNIWKERRMYINQLFRKCMKIAKKGVVWTSYIQKDEIKAEGDYVSIQDVPKWIDVVLYETDVLIKAVRKTVTSGQEFGAIVESSKWKAIPETGYTDVTGVGMPKLIKDKKLFNGG